MYQITPETESLIDRAIYEDLSIGERSAAAFEEASDVSHRGSVTQKVELHFRTSLSPGIAASMSRSRFRSWIKQS